MNEFIDQILKKHISPSLELLELKSISGGCINNSYRVSTTKGLFFLKWNREELIEMFDTEARGLKLLNNLSPIINPTPLAKGTLDNRSYLLTEWLEQGAQSATFWGNFGENLAKQHKETSSTFGLDHDNFIGSLTQRNNEHKNWSDFFIHERLEPQIKLASSNGLISNKIQTQFEVLFSKLDQLVPLESPALLHGDLWSGNFMVDHSGEAAIFDPAVHYGHRETELSFTKLFGGFSERFYNCYNDMFPLEPEFDNRIDIHNLYPLLVHVNLFGSSYLSGVVQTLNRFT